MSDEVVRAEIRRREANKEPPFQAGDVVTVAKHGDYEEADAEARIKGQDIPAYAESDRFGSCHHPEQWTLVRPFRAQKGG